MSLIFDAVLLISSAIIIISGTVRGFVKSVMQLASGVASALAAYALTTKYSAVVSEKYLLEPITSGIEGTIESLVIKNGDGFNLTKLFEDKPDAFLQIVNRYGADMDELEGIFGTSDSAVKEALHSLSVKIAAPVADALASVITFTLIFAASLLVLGLITWILDLIFKLPVLRTANKVLGFIFGLIGAALMCWLLSVVSIKLIGSMTSIYPEQFNQSVIDNSIILKYFAENNLMELFTGFLAKT